MTHVPLVTCRLEDARPTHGSCEEDGRPEKFFLLRQRHIIIAPPITTNAGFLGSIRLVPALREKRSQKILIDSARVRNRLLFVNPKRVLVQRSARLRRALPSHDR